MLFRRVRVAAARKRAVLLQRANKRQRSIDLWRKRHLRHEISEPQILSPLTLAWWTNLFGILRAGFFFRNERTFDVNAHDARAAERFVVKWFRRFEHVQDFLFRCG